MITSIGLLTVFALLAAALSLALFRLIRGPSLPDRVVALDLIAMLAVAISATHAVLSDQRVYLDVSVVVALLSFIGTVAFARYLEKRGHP